jgi:VWFA-related protein
MTHQERILVHSLTRSISASHRAIVLVPLAFVCLMGPGCSLVLTALAQSPGHDASSLRIEAREVVLDIVVTDRRGNFVAGLGKGDFTILEDGKGQDIRSFEQTAIDTLSTIIPEVTSSRDLYRIGDAPVAILVLDELNTKFEDMAYARDALRKWLLRQPVKLTQPTILMSSSDSKLDVIHDFTQDRDALLRALKDYFPVYPYRMTKGGISGPDAGERMALSLGAVQQIAKATSGTPGRKNVIWVGVGFPTLLLDDLSSKKEDEIAAAVERTTATMLNARVTLNVVDPTAPSTSSLDMNNPQYLDLSTLGEAMGPSPGHIDGILSFDEFAPETGGIARIGRNDVDREIQRAVDSGTHYYTLAYSPTDRSDKAAQFRRIRVVMKDPSLTATTRSGYFQEPESPLGTAPKPPSTHDLAFDLMNAALSSLVYDGLKVTLVRGPARYTLMVGAGDLGPHILTTGQHVAEVTVMRVCFDRKRRVLEHSLYEEQAVEPPNVSAGQFIRFQVDPEPIPKATARIRLVVRDAISGHIGTVEIENP